MKQITVNGEELSVLEHECQSAHEEWNRYVLDDGTQLRVKVHLDKVYRAYNSDGTPDANQYGDPVVVVTHHLQVVATEG